MSQYVKVPKAQLESLEAARLRLHELLLELKIPDYRYVDFMPVSSVMWYIANKKWEVLDD
jgi:hypothetical protein